MHYRRLRQSPALRELAREVLWSPKKLVQPYFWVEGLKTREEIPGLPQVYRETSDSLSRQIESDLEIGTKKALLFGVPKEKKEHDFSQEGFCEVIRQIKSRFGKDLLLATDVCVCSLTTHGQCGVLNDDRDHVDNSRTVHELAALALHYAQAGADIVAPSDMMDGRVKAIRQTLDKAALERTLILSYSAKFQSHFYGPFRAAADSAPNPKKTTLKDRSTYQIDPARPSDAYLSSLRDAEEGADLLMVKPGLPYLDVLARLSKEIPLPWAVYEVSGEYAAIELLGQKGLINSEQAHYEAWTSFFRAGASFVITYGARHAFEIHKKYSEI